MVSKACTDAACTLQTLCDSRYWLHVGQNIPAIFTEEQSLLLMHLLYIFSLPNAGSVMPAIYIKHFTEYAQVLALLLSIR